MVRSCFPSEKVLVSVMQRNFSNIWNLYGLKTWTIDTKREQWLKNFRVNKIQQVCLPVNIMVAHVSSTAQAVFSSSHHTWILRISTASLCVSYSSSSVCLCLLGLLEIALWDRNCVLPLGCLRCVLCCRKHFMTWIWTVFNIGSHTQQYHGRCNKDSEAWLLLLALWKPSQWALKSRVRLG